MLGTNLALDDVDKLVQAFEAGDDQALMEATGQSQRAAIAKLVCPVSTLTTMQRTTKACR